MGTDSAIHDPHVIVFGNEKGGSGKSTAAMHVAVGLLRLGHTVGTVDLDVRQGTFTRYFQAREKRAEQVPGLPLPKHRSVERGSAASVAGLQEDERARFEDTLYGLIECDVIIIDTPGSDSHLARMAHMWADTLVTPINDSFIDLDLLARIDPETHRIIGPSVYAEMVFEQRRRRALAGGKPVDWIVMRNRLSSLDARNKREIGTILTALSKRIQFRVTPGFGERVIFRELFLKGLTLLDLIEAEGTEGLTMSHLSARQEVRSLIQAIGISMDADPA